MRTKVTLVLVFLNVALFFFIFKFEHRWGLGGPDPQTVGKVFGPEAADIRTLAITNLAGGSFSLTRQRETWLLTQPLEWPANPRAASAIVTELQLLKNETAFNVADLAKNNLSLADYGLALDQPAKLTVAFSSYDPAVTGSAGRALTELRIGDVTKDGKRLYVLSPDRERVHIVNRSLLDTLSPPLDQLRADTLLSVPVFEARSLLIQTASAAGVRVRIRRDGTRWTFETPILARAGRTAIEVAINQLNALRAKSFPATAPATLPSVAPTLRVTLEGNGRHETLFLGEPVPPPAGAKPAPNAPVEYYAQIEGRAAVFTVEIPAGPEDLVAQLRNAQESLREKRVLDLDSTAVTAITLAAPAQPNLAPLTLQRLELRAGQTASATPPWQLVLRADGAQAAQTLPADRAAVQRLLEQLSLLMAKKFKSDAPTSADLEDWGFNRPLREATLTVTGSAAPVVLRIGTDSNRTTYYARVGTATEPGTSIYQVTPEIEKELSLSALTYRDRAVTEPLAPSARIAALKLTDLETKAVLFEATVNAAGEAAPAPRDPKAVAAVVAALRALRAKEFLPGGFAEKIAAAGTERTWRLQLDATIALPAPGGTEQTSPFALLLTERLGGSTQFAGSKELDMVFSLDQPLVDALWSLAYGARDPGPRPEPKP